MAQAQLRVDTPPSGHLRTADILRALSFAADLAVGLPAGHGVRSCYIGRRIADLLQLPSQQQAALYYSELLMDAGCTAWAGQFAMSIMGDEIPARRQFYFHTDAHNPVDMLSWLQEYVAVGAPAHVRARRILDFALHGKERVREALRNTADVAQRFASRLGMPSEVQETLWCVFEQWDGSGPNGARGELAPVTSRIVYATSLIAAFHNVGGRAAAIQLAQARKGKAFDPSVADAFLAIAGDNSFWDELEQESIWTTVSSMEPQSPHRYLAREKLEDVALAFADFADLKCFYSLGHSRRVGDLSERIARRMRLPEGEVRTVRLAALLHDIGLAAVPAFSLNRPEETLTPFEWERLRLHPYHGERILSRVPDFQPVVPLVAAHHERPDGRGYYRGLPRPQIPLGASVIAVAERFEELSQGRPDHPPLDPQTTLKRMKEEAGRGLEADAVEALAQELGSDESATTARRSHSSEWPAGLTDREVEILRLLAGGGTRKEMADRLFLSEHTVRHHLEHIYNKIGVSTRVAATLFAVEHDLLH